jgi:HTH-type transcriptional regulator / antitoxin HigA
LTTKNLKPIKTKKDYQQALGRFELIFDSKKEPKKGDELEILVILIDQYQNEHFPNEAIKFRLCMKTLKKKLNRILFG